MGFLEDMDKRVKKFGIIDVKLAQGAAIFFVLVIAKLIPQIMNINIWWFAAPGRTNRRIPGPLHLNVLCLLGGLFSVVSFDLHRHKLLLCYLGVAIVIFGAALLVVDLLEGMPLYWSLMQRPFNVVFGVVIFMLAHRLGEKEYKNYGANHQV